MRQAEAQYLVKMAYFFYQVFWVELKILVQIIHKFATYVTKLNFYVSKKTDGLQTR